MATFPSIRKQARFLAAWLLLGGAVAAAHAKAGDAADPNAPAPSGASSTPASSSAPALPTPYASPLRRSLRYYAQSTWSSRNFAEAALIAGVPHLNNAPAQPAAPSVIDLDTLQSYSDQMQQYSNDMDDWRRSSEEELRYRGRRFGFGLATAETRDLLSNLVLPTALRQDPRYLPANPDSGLGNRLSHAAESVFVTRNNSGSVAPNYSKWIGTIGAAVIAKHLYADRMGVPQLNSNQFVWRYIGYSIAGDMATNVANELLRASLKDDLANIESEGPATEKNYYPLTAAGTVASWAHSTYAPQNFIQGGLFAGIPNISSEPEYPAEPPIHNKEEAIAYGNAIVQYGNKMEAWRQSTDEEIRYHGKRFLAGFSESETQMFLGRLVLPLSVRMDGRYIPSGANGVGARFGSAFKQIAVAHTYAGNEAVNIPLLGSTVGAAFIAQHMYYNTLGVPELNSNRVTAKTIGFNLAGDLLLNMMHEFSPHRTY